MRVQGVCWLCLFLAKQKLEISVRRKEDMCYVNLGFAEKGFEVRFLTYSNTNASLLLPL